MANPKNQRLHQHPEHNQPSSSESGFFQEKPTLENQFDDDIVLQRILSLYLPLHILEPLYEDLESFASDVLSPKILHWLEDAEANPPTLELHDAYAARRDNLKTSEGWRKLAKFGAREGMVAEGYERNGGGRVVQFAKYYLFSPSSAITTCPFAMTDGAARLLANHISSNTTFTPLSRESLEAEAKKKVFVAAYKKLTSRDAKTRWTSGQWMTERPGGSDVSRSETMAVYNPFAPGSNPGPEEEQLGPWVITGHKFFSSATDAEMTILLAQTENGGGRLSAFYAPMKLPNGESNGVRIVRLKKKLGTKALPTAELELKGMRAWMIGEEGFGIREISTILNITRVHNAVTAVSFMRRGLAVAKAFAKVRVVSKNVTLSSLPLHLRTLAHLELLHRASTHLTFFTTHLLSLAESSSSSSSSSSHYIPGDLYIPPGAGAAALFRLLTPLTKALTAKLAIATLSESCESMGGVGYCENEEPLNLARLLRDAQVLSIWEGTTNVLITDLVSSLKRTSRGGLEKRGWGVVGEFIQENLARAAYSGQGNGELKDSLEKCKVVLWEEWKQLEDVLEMKSQEELTAGGRIVLWRLGYILCGVLLLVDARRDGERGTVEIARRWVLEMAGVLGWEEKQEGPPVKERQRAREDFWIVYGEELPTRPML